jgi:hypothetical protein
MSFKKAHLDLFWGPHLVLNAGLKSDLPSLEKRNKPFDGVFISTRNRPDFVEQVLGQTGLQNLDVTVLATDPSDIRHQTLEKFRPSVIFLSELSPSLKAIASAGELPFEFPLVAKSGWDIWQKRNLILHLAQSREYRNILILDDDVLGLTPELVMKMSMDLRSHKISGLYFEGNPDHSLVGGLIYRFTGQRRRFLGSACLAMRLGQVTQPKFLNLYNEDWFFMFGNESGNVISSGSLVQDNYPRVYQAENLIAQECGDLIAEFWRYLRIKQSFKPGLESFEELIQHRISLVNDLKDAVWKSEMRSKEELASLDELKVYLVALRPEVLSKLFYAVLDRYGIRPENFKRIA